MHQTRNTWYGFARTSLETYPEIHRLIRGAKFRRVVGTLDGDRLTRVPRGYAADDPVVGDYLQTQALPSRAASSPPRLRQAPSSTRRFSKPSGGDAAGFDF